MLFNKIQVGRPSGRGCCDIPAVMRLMISSSHFSTRPTNGVVLAKSSFSGMGTQSERALHADIGKVLFSEAQIQESIARLGREIGRDYQGKETLVIGVMKGGFMFTADLVRSISPLPQVLEMDFFKASSYGTGTETSGKVKLDSGFDIRSITGKHVLLVEDIVDSGLTLTAIVEMLKSSGHAASVKVCALLDKRARRRVEFEADYVGFVCPDEFIVGFGIDFSERYRNLPYIGVPTDEAVARVTKEVEVNRLERQKRKSDAIKEL